MHSALPSILQVILDRVRPVGLDGSFRIRSRGRVVRHGTQEPEGREHTLLHVGQEVFVGSTSTAALIRFQPLLE